MVNFSALYSKYYNLLYAEKDYAGEFSYVFELLKEYSKIPIKSVLDIGCGTVRHLKEFQKQGLEIAGIDLSQSQLDFAKKALGKKCLLQCAKADEFSFGRKFDSIVSLFHVMSYQTSNDELQKVFVNASKHLNAGGVFVFDFWHGVGVLSDPPVVRIKRLQNGNSKIIRLAEPVMLYSQNVVEVNYEVISSGGSFKEQHRMRYLFEQELKLFAKLGGLELLTTYKWLTKNPLNDAWYGICILRKEKGEKNDRTYKTGRSNLRHNHPRQLFQAGH
jgi:SAM-dependent methyltransferase